MILASFQLVERDVASLAAIFSIFWVVVAFLLAYPRVRLRAALRRLRRLERLERMGRGEQVRPEPADGGGSA
ncbi:MAG: hypothetical protein Kow0069_14770 [Promethearchaeota archaeon]